MRQPFANRCAVLMLGVTLSLMGAVPAVRGGDTPRSLELRRKLAASIKFGGIDDPKTTLTEALDQIAKRYDLAFDINDQAFKDTEVRDVGKAPVAEGTPVPEMHTRLETILKKVLTRVSPKATYVIRDDTIEITTTDALRKEFYPGRTEAVLPPLVQGQFDGKPLDEALRELSQGTGITVLLDGRTIKDGKTPVTADLMNVPLDTAVRLLADMVGLKMVQVDAVYYVTTADNARALREEQEKLRLERKRNEEKAPEPPAKADKPARDSSPHKP